MASRTTLDSRRAIDSCTFQIHSWRPFHLPTISTDHKPLLDYSDSKTHYSSATGAHSKRPCLSDRTTSFSIDISKLSLIDDDRSVSSGLRLIDRKRRRRRHGPRSVSGRSSDWSGTQRMCCSLGASAAYGTCSDFPLAAGTDSSGELFLNGEGNWASDVSEAAAAKSSRREREGGSGEKECLGAAGAGQIGSNFDCMGNESGYGSEPGYRGDAELGDGDEVDEEEDDQRLLFWGENIGDSNMEMVGENNLQKTHHRCRRKKNDIRMVDLQ